MIIWSDDCLSCLCNLPHSEEQHAQAVNTALQESRRQLEDARVANSLSEKGSNSAGHMRKLSPRSYMQLVEMLETSLHGY